MLYGALSERTKKAQSDSFSPALPHPHIISWKIPDICCNFFFFLLWYRQGFNIQMPLDPAMYPQISSLFPVGLQPSARQQIILTRSWSKGSAFSVDRQQTRSHRKYQIRRSPYIVLLHSLCVCWCLEAPRFFRWIFFPLPFSFLEYRGRYLNIPKVCRTCSPACHVFLFPDMPLPLSLSKAEAHCLATNKLLRSAQTKTGLKKIWMDSAEPKQFFIIKIYDLDRMSC